ncbi:MAG: ABC transporter substrate-binding protein [Acidimicrobiales bacterium]
MHRRSFSAFVAVFLAFAMIAAACGGSDRESATTDDPPADDGAAETPADDDGAADDGAATDDGAEEPADDAGAEEPADDAGAEEPVDDAAMFGDLPLPCGPGDASGATDQGVTDTTITIGAGDDRGFASSPGLNEQMTAAARAIVAVCNEAGGINGRQIELIDYDAKLFEVSTVMLDACDNVFMLVGEGFAVDGFGEETRVQCELAHVPAWTVSAAAAHGPGMVQPLPNPADQLPLAIAAYLAETYPDAITSSATMFGNFSATIETKDKVVEAYPALGYEFLADLEYNVNGEEDWTPFVLQLEDAGAEFVYFSGSCLPNFQQLRSAAAVNDYEAIWQTDANFYDSACAQANADGVLDGTYMRLAIVPFEEREANAATDDYMTMMEDAGEGISAVAVQTVSAFLMWATAASECGSELTRACVIDTASTFTEWTGHGLHVPTNPGANETPDCGIVMQLVGTEYQRVWPTEPGTFDCDPSYRAEITTQWSEEAALDENRVSQQFTG